MRLARCIVHLRRPAIDSRVADAVHGALLCSGSARWDGAGGLPVTRARAGNTALQACTGARMSLKDHEMREVDINVNINMLMLILIC